MHKQRMFRLANFIEKLPEEKFNMGGWVYTEYPPTNGVMCNEDALTLCGTTCCIAGWATFRAGKCVKYWSDALATKTGRLVTENGVAVRISKFAEKYLGLTPEQASALFYSNNWPEQFQPDDNKKAAERIRHMARTGE